MGLLPGFLVRRQALLIFFMVLFMVVYSRGCHGARQWGKQPAGAIVVCRDDACKLEFVRTLGALLPRGVPVPPSGPSPGSH